MEALATLFLMYMTKMMRWNNRDRLAAWVAKMIILLRVYHFLKLKLKYKLTVHDKKKMVHFVPRVSVKYSTNIFIRKMSNVTNQILYETHEWWANFIFSFNSNKKKKKLLFRLFQFNRIPYWIVFQLQLNSRPRFPFLTWLTPNNV